MASTDTPATGSSHLRLTIPSLSHTQLVPEELEELVRETPTTGAFSALTVVDVRAGDFNGGHLRGSVHISFESLESSWSSLVSQVSAARVARLVFVCLNGRQRSPVVAETFLAKFKDEAGPEAEAPQVYVLTTGFTGVLNRYIDIAADKTGQIQTRTGRRAQACMTDGSQGRHRTHTLMTDLAYHVSLLFVFFPASPLPSESEEHWCGADQ